MTKYIRKLSEQKGITLIEVMISILLLGIALGAIAFSLQMNLTNADALRNNTIASGLAQEGIEVVRNIRDQEWITTGTFGSNIPDGSYEIEWNSTSLSASQSRYIKKDLTTGIFSYGLGSDTIFKRIVTITTVSANEKRVDVSITWSSRDVDHVLSAESHLFNWY